MTLPKEFVEYTSRLFGPEKWQRFVDAMDEEPPVSVRMNPWKAPAGAGSDAVAQSVVDGLDDAVAVPWCQGAYWLAERPNFTLDPLLHAGCYYVQEAGSMFLGQVCQTLLPMLPPVLRALDLCAAPGGKSSLLRQMLSDASWLVSNEPDHKRANILMENLQKQGHPRVTVVNGYARDFARSKMSFDMILCDVPCSGEGMFRKDSGAISEWSLSNVMKCAELQRSIVEDIWPCLNDGGVMVYSTCTFNTHENEENVRWIMDNLGAELIPIPTAEEWNVQSSLMPGFDAPVYRFIPGTTRSEGLFMAVMRKKGDALSQKQTADDVVPTQKQLAKLRVMHSGVPSGITKGKDFIPDHALALSLALDGDTNALLSSLSAADARLYNNIRCSAKTEYPHCELSLDDARRYLHREVVTLPQDAPRGFVIVTYRGVPIGFVKNIGSRANNLYPKEWAIKKL